MNTNVNTSRDRLAGDTEPFVMIPHEAKRIAQNDGLAAFAVYYILKMHLNHRTGALFPAQQTMAAELGVNRDTISDALKKLVAHDVVIAKRRFASSTLYFLNAPSKWNYPLDTTPFAEKFRTPLRKNSASFAEKFRTNNMNEQDEFNNIINDKIKIENSPNAIGENQQPHDVGKMNNTQDANRGPKGRPLNPQFELYRAYCECRGEDVDDAEGRGIRLKQFTKEFVRTMSPDDVRSLYNYVYNKFLYAAQLQGNNTVHSLPTMTHLKKYITEWRASLSKGQVRVPHDVVMTNAQQLNRDDEVWQIRTKRTKLRIFEKLYNEHVRTLDDLKDEGLTLEEWETYIKSKEG